MKVISFLFLIAVFFSCSDKRMNQSTPQKTEQDEKKLSDSKDLILADEPVMVSGSLLTCETTRESDQVSDTTDIGCAILNNDEKVELPFADLEVTIEIIDGEDRFPISEYQTHDPFEPWHWTFAIPTNYVFSGIVRIHLIHKTSPLDVTWESPILSTVLPPSIGQLPTFNLTGLLENPEGMKGGHIDITTSSEVYPFEEGKVDGYVHEYDKQYLLNGADFFDFQDAGLSSIQSLIPAKKSFRIITVNAELSPSAVITINGKKLPVTQFNELTKDLRFQLGPVQDTSHLSLVELKVSFPADAILNEMIQSSRAKSVIANRQGTNGEYRNGVLTVQAVADDALLDFETGAAMNGLLWESTTFWHDRKILDVFSGVQD